MMTCFALPTGCSSLVLPLALVSACAILASAPKAQAQCETAMLIPSDGQEDERFGLAADISGNVLVIGVPYDDDQGDKSGSAYVFRRDGFTWTEEQKLLPADGDADDQFGYSVAIEGDRILVGAHLDGDTAFKAGAVYAYRFDGSSWVQHQKLTAFDAETGDRFGRAVAIDGDVVVVGAKNNDDQGSNSGSAYVYREDGSSWNLEQKLLGPDGEVSDLFGFAVAVDEDIIVVGARNGGYPGEDTGSADVFHYNGNSWEHDQKLLPSDGEDGQEFGSAIVVSGDLIVVGAPLDHNQRGAVYVYRHDGVIWSEETKLLAPDGNTDDYLGSAIAVSGDGDTILAGAWEDGDLSDQAGSVYVFRYTGDWWIPETKLFGSELEWDNYFGYAVALDGQRAVITANGAHIYGEYSGAAYLFDFTGPDCNDNYIPDACDIASGFSEDVNGDGVPDECVETCPSDANGDGVVDVQDLLALLGVWGPCP